MVPAVVTGMMRAAATGMVLETRRMGRITSFHPIRFCKLPLKG